MPRRTTQRSKKTHCMGDWNGIAFRVTHTSDYLIMGADHLEIETIRPTASRSQPGRPPLPITSTGYLSHFTRDKSIPDATAARRFFLEWIARETATTTYRKAQAKRDQLDLFADLPIEVKPRS